MAAPNLSARVPIDQRFRVVYRLTAPFRSLFAGAAGNITALWQGQPSAMVISPATTPEIGARVLSAWLAYEAFTSIDLKASHTLPSVTWDAFLSPFRRPVLAMLTSGVEAEIHSVELLTPAALSASVAPATRTLASQQPAQRSRANAPTLAGLATTATSRLTLLAGLVVVGIVIWKIGPQLMAAVQRRK